MITEGKARLALEEPDKITKDNEIFYNPVMSVNRDMSILLLNALGRTGLRIADPLAGSGVRSVRFTLELADGVIGELKANDIRPSSVEKIKENMLANGVRFKVCNMDADRFLLEERPFDHIDIDPFGPPNDFLQAAVKSIFNEGVIAVTATDTSALSGTYPRACRRKYWAEPLRNELMHEIGLRILIRKVQLVGAQFNVCVLPLYSFSTEHYMRCFLQCRKGKARADDVIRKHSFLLHCPRCLYREVSRINSRICGECGNSMDAAGPMWVGRLWDKDIALKIKELSVSMPADTHKLASLIAEESKVDSPFFYDVHRFWKRSGVNVQKRMSEIMSALPGSGRTHFSRYGIRTEKDYKKVKEAIL